MTGRSCKVLSLPHRQGDSPQQSAGQEQVLRRAEWASHRPQTVPVARFLLRRPVVATGDLHRPPWADRALSRLAAGGEKHPVPSAGHGCVWQTCQLRLRCSRPQQTSFSLATNEGCATVTAHAPHPQCHRASWRPLPLQPAVLNPMVTLFPSSTQEAKNIKILTSHQDSYMRKEACIHFVWGNFYIVNCLFSRRILVLVCFLHHLLSSQPFNGGITEN